MAQTIKAIKLTPKGKVYLEFNRASASKNEQGVVNKNEKVTSDLTPHADFLRSLDRLRPHLTIAIGFHEPVEYTLDNVTTKFRMLDKEWFDKFSYADDPRFSNVTITGAIVVGKEAADGIYLLGTYENPNGGITKLKSPLIEFIKKGDGTDYKLLDILTAQFETLVTEAIEFQNELKFAGDVQGDLFEENVRKMVYA